MAQKGGTSYLLKKEQEGIRLEKNKEAKVKAITTARKRWETVVQEHDSKMSLETSVSAIASMNIVKLQSLSIKDEMFCFKCGGLNLDCRECDAGKIPRKKKHQLKLKYREITFSFPMEIADYELTYLSEIVSGNLHLYGSKAVAAAVRHKWGVKTVSTIHTLSFHFVVFDDDAYMLGKLRNKFRNIEAAAFECSCLKSLSQINAFAQLPRLKKLIIKDEGNPILMLSFWKDYAIYRLSPAIQQINGSMVTELEREKAETLFGVLAFNTSLLLPEYRLHSLIKNPRMKQELKRKMSSSQSVPESKLTGELMKAPFNYDPLYKLPSPETKRMAKILVETNIKSVHEIMKKRSLFKRLWPTMFSDIIDDALTQFHDIDQCMEQARKDLLELSLSKKKNV